LVEAATHTASDKADCTASRSEDVKNDPTS
jgi:hypothetical protein